MCCMFRFAFIYSNFIFVYSVGWKKEEKIEKWDQENVTLPDLDIF